MRLDFSSCHFIWFSSLSDLHEEKVYVKLTKPDHKSQSCFHRLLDLLTLTLKLICCMKVLPKFPCILTTTLNFSTNYIISRFFFLGTNEGRRLKKNESLNYNFRLSLAH